MAIPRQSFRIFKGKDIIDFKNNYFLPLLTPDQARTEWCKLGGCNTPCGNGDKCGITAKEVKYVNN